MGFSLMSASLVGSSFHLRRSRPSAGVALPVDGVADLGLAVGMQIARHIPRGTSHAAQQDQRQIGESWQSPLPSPWHPARTSAHPWCLAHIQFAVYPVRRRGDRLLRIVVLSDALPTRRNPLLAGVYWVPEHFVEPVITASERRSSQLILSLGMSPRSVSTTDDACLQFGVWRMQVEGGDRCPPVVDILV